MKAIVYKKYGPPNVLRLVEIEKPKPKSNEILVKICATTVSSGDVRLRSSNFPILAWFPARLIFGLFKPKREILGHEFSGVVEAVGKDVSQYKVGDEVMATSTILKTGSYTEYVCIPQCRKKGVLCFKPKNLSFIEAAALPIGGLTAMFLLCKANVQQGQQVLIYGASGSVGSYAIQIAKEQGATIVAVCSSSSFDMVKSLGADSVIDYQEEDYSLLGRRFDIVFDAVGKTSKGQGKRVLRQGGSFVSVKSFTSPTPDHLRKLNILVEKQKIKPYIDKCFTLSEIVAAHKYVDTGRKKGNVVVEIGKLLG